MNCQQADLNLVIPYRQMNSLTLKGGWKKGHYDEGEEKDDEGREIVKIGA